MADESKVVIFGAGASFHLGCPLAGDLLPAALDYAAALPASHYVHHLAGLARKFLRNNAPALTVGHFGARVLAELSASQQLFNDLPRLPVQSFKPIEQILTDLRRATRRTAYASVAGFEPFQGLVNLIFALLARPRPLAASAYVQFLRALSERASTRSILLVSFNWDGHLDAALGELQANKWSRWNYGFSAQAIHPSRNYHAEPVEWPDVCLLKPHGSVTWRSCRRCHRLHVDPLLSTFSVARMNLYNGPACAYCGDQLDLLCLPPMLDKQYESYPYRELLTRFRDTLRRADSIAVVGYSFPPGDPDILDALKEAPRSARITVIFDASLVSRLEQIGFTAVKLLPQGFERSVPELADELLE